MEGCNWTQVQGGRNSTVFPSKANVASLTGGQGISLPLTLQGF